MLPLRNFPGGAVFYSLMKISFHKPRHLVPLLSLTLLPLTGLLAQADPSTNSSAPSANQPSGSAPNQPPPPPEEGPGGWHHHDGMGFGSLTPAERQQLFADMKQIKDNPQLATAREAVKQAMQTLDQTRETLLLQADPSIQAVLTKIKQARQNHPGQGGPEGPQGPQPQN